MAAKAKGKAKKAPAASSKDATKSSAAKKKAAAKKKTATTAKAKTKAKAKAKSQPKAKAKSAPAKTKAKAKSASKSTTASKTATAKAKATPRSKSASSKSTVTETPTKQPKAKKAATKKAATKKTPAKKKASKKQEALNVVVPAAKRAADVPDRTGKPTAAELALAAAKAKPRTPTKMAEMDVQAPSARQDSPFRNFTPYMPNKTETYMNSEQLEHFRQILRNWRHELMEEVDRTVHHMRDEAANFPDPADRATQEEEFSIELRTRDRERKLIRKIDATLERVDQDDYGYCDTCGIEIGIRRLEARPTATQCVDCKSLEEIKEGQLHG